VAPGLTTDLLGLVNRFLPDEADSASERLRGNEASSAVSESFLTRLGKKAAREYQHQEPTRPARSRIGAPQPAEALGS